MAARVVCISRTYAALGEEIGDLVAEQLCFRYVDEQVIERAARLAQVDPKVIAAVEQRRPLLQRLMAKLAAARDLVGPAALTPVIPVFDGVPAHGGHRAQAEDVRLLIQAAIHEIAKAGGADTDCQSGACVSNLCGCPEEHDFEYTVHGSSGGTGTGAEWPGGEMTLSAGGGCDVTIGLPDQRVDRVCTLGAPFSVKSAGPFSSCTVTSCGDVSCPIAGIGSCCLDRPSCSSALNGAARATVSVRCQR
jgi:hypothetical protein